MTSVTTRDLLAEIGELYVRNKVLTAELERERQKAPAEPLHIVPPAEPDVDDEVVG